MNPVLQSERLRLRWLQFQDAPFILELLNTPGWLRFIGDRKVHSLEDARNYIRNGPMAVRAKYGFALLRVSLQDADDTPIGLCGLLKREHLDAPDIGFAFLPAYSGQGYAQEGARAVLQWARVAHAQQRILAICLPDNQSSIRLLERIGFHRIELLPANENGERLLLLGTG